MEIKVHDFIGSKHAFSEIYATKVYKKICETIEHKEKITVDFTGCEVISSDFISISICRIFKVFAKKTIKKYLCIIHNQIDRHLFKMSIEQGWQRAYPTGKL